MRRLVIAAFVVLCGCARSESSDVPILARPVLAPKPNAPCERIPTDLAPAAPPYLDSVDWSADASMVAGAVGQSGNASTHVEGAEGIVVWSAADGVVRKRYRVLAQRVAFAHAGRRLAFSSVGETGIIDLTTDCAERWPRPGPLVKWSADDRSLSIAGGKGAITIDATHGSLLREWLPPEGSLRIVSLDAAPNVLVLGDEIHVVRTFRPDLSPLDVLDDRPDGIGNARAVAVAPNGSLVASADIEQIARPYSPHTMPTARSTPRFSVRVVTLPNRRVRDVFPGDPEALAFSPDSTSLATAGTLDARLTVRDMSTGEMRVLDDRVSYPQQIAWSPDGRSLALADWRGAVRVYDVRGDVRGPGAPRIFVP